jgi:hypothetical protein
MLAGFVAERPDDEPAMEALRHRDAGTIARAGPARRDVNGLARAREAHRRMALGDRI